MRIGPSLVFIDQLRDEESGLCYNRFRYYNPQTANYISPDPIGILGGENNYGYVSNSVSWVDPFGLSKCSVLDDIINDANKVASPGGANRWWNLMPTNGALPNHSLPRVPGHHAAGGTLRTTIQQGRKALPPGTITDLRLPYG